MKTILLLISFPFNQHTYFGFILVNVLQQVNAFCYFTAACLVPAYFMSVCFYITAMCDDFENIFLDLDKSVNVGYNKIYSKLITAINLQNSVGA